MLVSWIVRVKNSQIHVNITVILPQLVHASYDVHSTCFPQKFLFGFLTASSEGNQSAPMPSHTNTNTQRYTHTHTHTHSQREVEERGGEVNISTNSYTTRCRGAAHVNSKRRAFAFPALRPPARKEYQKFFGLVFQKVTVKTASWFS